MFGMAPATPYDLRFRLLDVPVRVHPLFWLIMALLGAHGDDRLGIFIFVGCAFVSILVHEFGHALSARAFGSEPLEVVLYGMGGYCASDMDRHSPWQRLGVLFAGPGAGFLLAALVALLRHAAGPRELSRSADEIYQILLFINIWWGLVNLLPIWPLDGGQMTEVVLSMFNRREGRRRAHVVGLLTAGALAIVVFQLTGQLFMTIWFAYFGYVNYQQLQTIHQSSRYGSFDDDADWWKR
jgi:Zn-dependent protease